MPPRPSSRIFIQAISTFFYVGYLPFMPGTFASLAGLWIFFILKDNAVYLALVAFILIILGFAVSGKFERILNRKDAKIIVIDEVSGMFLSLLFVPVDLKLVIIGFLLFRILDTLKPYPASRLQELKGSAGIMSDDLVAALLTNIILQAVARLATFRAS